MQELTSGRRWRWSFFLLAFFLLAVFTWRLAGRATDDMYITYRYAQNLAVGRGLVFNPEERVFGVTDPGVAVLLAAMHRASGVPIHLLGTALTGVALLTCAAAIFAAARARDRGPEGLAAGVLLLTSAYLWVGQGSGPPVVLALLLAAAWLAERKPHGEASAGLLAGLAVACRPDGIVGAGLLGLMLWRERRRFPRTFALAAGATILAGAGWAWAWFGTVVPNTLAAKRAYATLDPDRWAGLASFWGHAVRSFSSLAGPLAAPLLVLLLLGISGLVPLARAGGRPGRLLAANGVALAGIYPLLGVPFFLWYGIPPVVALLAAAPFAAGAAVRWLLAAGRVPRFVVAGLAVLLALPLAASVAGGFLYLLEPGRGEWRLPAYSQAGAWIRAHSRPGDDIAAEEIGILAYASDRPVQDLVGLVTPRSLPYARDRLGAFLAKPTELLIFHTYNRRGGTRPIVARPWFPAAYEEAVRFPSPDGTAYLAVYRRRPGARIPPPRPPRLHGK